MTIQLLANPSDYQTIISEGVASTVSKVQASSDGNTIWVIAKRATINQKFSPEPHDILKELRILARCYHPNIANFLGNDYEELDDMACIFLEHIPIPLTTVLSSPAFSPLPLDLVHAPDERDPVDKPLRFEIVSKSILFQTLLGLAYLHSPQIQVAHRDIKPGNIHITSEGLVKLIDFGVSLDGQAKEPSPDNPVQTVWPEKPHHLYFEVSTGPYRAPELLFGSRTYDPYAIDLWSFGSTMAEFYTSLTLHLDHDDDDDADWDNDESEDDPINKEKPFVVPSGLTVVPQGARWDRQSLFDGSRGEIGLAWSIFKIRGTPNQEIWPGFDSLPHALGVHFIDTPTVDFTPFLPHLPLPRVTTERFKMHSPPQQATEHPADLLHRFLVYSPEQRIQAQEALNHPWFSHHNSVLLPKGHAPTEMTIAKTELDEGERLRAYLLQLVGDVDDSI